MKRTFTKDKIIIELDSTQDLSSIKLGLNELLTQYQALASAIATHPNPEEPDEASWWADQIVRIEKLLKQL